MVFKVSQLSAQTRIKRNRLLSSDGHVKVVGGQEVKTGDVIAETDSHHKHILLNVRNALQANHSEDIEQYIHRKELEWIEKGDLIAEKGGLFRRVLRSPAKGKIISISNGKILIEVQNPTINLFSGFDGRVVEIFPDRGAAIETSGALLQCVWGNNQIDSGTLILPQSDLEKTLDPSYLDMNMRGSIIAAGNISTTEAINSINHLNPSGLIVGSISARLYSIIRSQQYPIVLLEGFGHIPLNRIATAILQDNQNQHVCINAQYSNRDFSTRPEIVIPSEEISEQEISLPVEFMPGQKVRIHNMSVESNIGTIDKLYTDKVKFNNGIFADAASVFLDSYSTVNCPLSNLEILVS